jgi:hypothetical protein
VLVGVQMALEREEHEELLAKRPQAGNDRTVLAGLAQAALKADAVTGDASWDTYCSYIQRAIDVAKQQRAAQMAILTSPAMVNDEKITAARHSIFQMDERIRSLEWVVNMPAEIKRVGSVAKEKLAAMDVQDAEAEVPDAA